MAEDKDKEWAPKTREDWTGLFAEGFKSGLAAFRSDEEEAAAKNQGNNDADKNGGNDDSNAGKSKTFAEKLLGL